MGFFSKFKNFGFRREPLTPPTTYEPEIPTTVKKEAPPIVEEEIPPPPKPVEKKILELDIEEFGLDDLLIKLIEVEGSDLHLESGSPPVFRIKGDIYFTNIPPLDNESLETLLLPLISDRERKTFEKVGNIDFAYEIKDIARFRANLLKQYHGIGGVFRLIPSKIPTIDELNLPPVLKELAMVNRGIVVVTGPTGSGKSTTLAAMINYINHNRKGHIITIEDPIEFIHPSIKCLIDHRQVGLHTRSFPDALKASLREDPDIVMVGEMRDLETIALAMTAAEMGVLVFGTLHTSSASKTIDRIIEVFPSKQQDQIRTQLSQSLRGIVAQRLLKTADGKGRCAAVEVLICTSGIKNLIREGKTSQIDSFIQMGKEEGMRTMDDALVELVKEGKITKDTALEMATEPTRVKAKLSMR